MLWVWSEICHMFYVAIATTGIALLLKWCVKTGKMPEDKEFKKNGLCTG